MTRVTLTALPTASSRTKNRLREHPGTFTLKSTRNAQCFNGAVAHLLAHEDGWLGSIPADEVTLVEVDFA